MTTQHDQEQQVLDLPTPVYAHYSIEVRTGPLFGEELVRSYKASNVDDALNLIEGIREAYRQRNSVTWQSEEVDGVGKMLGLDDKQQVWMIQVTPALTTALGE